VKFHFKNPPKYPLNLLFKYINNGSAFGPLTFTFLKIGNVTPFSATNAAISFAVPGSCAPN